MKFETKSGGSISFIPGGLDTHLTMSNNSIMWLYPIDNDEGFQYPNSGIAK